ncbi:hypothetical protein [Pseudomonas sp. ES3-33]|nr:hypothetical protein [Pseudomonas sp. ES3-33]
MIFGKSAQHLTVNEMSQWLDAREAQLRARAQHLLEEDARSEGGV